MKPLIVAAFAVALSACSAQTRQHSVLAVADPQAPSTNRVYRSVAGETQNHKPVEPGSWIDANRRVSPGASDE